MRSYFGIDKEPHIAAAASWTQQATRTQPYFTAFPLGRNAKYAKIRTDLLTINRIRSS